MVAKRLWNLKDLVQSREAEFFAVEVQDATSWDIAQEGLEMTEFDYRAQGRKKAYKNTSKTINKMAIRTYILIITLNIHILNAATKSRRLAEWIQK